MQIRVLTRLEDELIRAIQKEKPSREIQRSYATANDGILARNTAESVSAEEKKLGKDGKSC
jgi:hypothetical protein